MPALRLAILTLALAAALVATAALGDDVNAKQEAPATGFLYKTATVDDETYAYTLYVPPDYDPNEPTPLVVFLHGSGERGSDGFLCSEVGIGTAIRRNHRMIPGLVLMPQCRQNDVWWSPAMTKMVVQCMNDTAADYNLDRQRLYLTGLSLGGGGCWHFAAVLPDTFAAVMPICAVSPEQMGYKVSLIDRLKDMPMWVFHGSADDRVPVSASRDMVRDLRAADADVRYTEYEGGGHAIWDQAYRDPQVWRWVFAQERGEEPKPGAADEAARGDAEGNGAQDAPNAE